MFLPFEHLVFFICSILITYISVPPLIKIGRKFKIHDLPSKRKLHKIPIVHLGGVGIALSFYIITSLLLILKSYLLFGIDLQIFTFLACSIIIFLVGLTDDISKLSPWSRLTIEIIVSCLFWKYVSKIEIADFTVLNLENLNIDFSYPLLSLFITVIWLTGMINAFNWMDGLDGLAAGLGLISATGISILHIINSQYLEATFSIIIAGSCLGFLLNNFYPAKIFMGDSGSYFLGFTIASLGILNLNSNENNIFISSFLILLIPIVDMLSVIIRRLIQKKSPFFPDNIHIHHLLLNSGLSVRKSVIFMLSLNFVLVLLVLYLNVF